MRPTLLAVAVLCLPEETFALEVDNVIAAIGQGIDFKGLPKSIHDNRSMAVNEHYETPLPGVLRVRRPADRT